MTVQAIDFKQLKCPYCKKSLSGEEYQHVMEEFKAKTAEEYAEHDKEREQYQS